jgi:thioredoxin-dependent peroxiredoxin
MASTDDIETNTAFAEKNGANFPILSDANGHIAELYGVKTILGIAKRRTFYISPEGKIAKIDTNVGVLTAGQDIVANLENLDVKKLH